MRNFMIGATLTVQAIALAGCATPPGKISPTYVSPAIYDSYSCDNIIEERQRIVAKVNELTGKQKDKATGDTVAMTVGLVIFGLLCFCWPSVATRKQNWHHTREHMMPWNRPLSKRIVEQHLCMSQEAALLFLV